MPLSLHVPVRFVVCSTLKVLKKQMVFTYISLFLGSFLFIMYYYVNLVYSFTGFDKNIPLFFHCANCTIFASIFLHMYNLNNFSFFVQKIHFFTIWHHLSNKQPSPSPHNLHTPSLNFTLSRSCKVMPLSDAF